MTKRLNRCVSMMLVLCMLWTSLPVYGLAWEAADAPTRAPAPKTLKTASATPMPEAPVPATPMSRTATPSEAAPKETAASATAAPTVTPETAEATSTPEAPEATATPEASEATATPEAAAPTATPETSEATSTPEAAEPTATPEAAEPTATPETAEATSTPEAAEATATPEAPEAPEATATPETTPAPTATVEPDIILSPETPAPTPTASEEPDLIFSPELLATSTPDATPTATPEATPTAEALRILSFDLSEMPCGVAVPYGTEEAVLDLPEALIANFSDGTTAPVPVVWVCVDDCQGGTAYNPMPEDPTVTFTFEAALAQEIPCDAEMPVMGVVFMDMPMLMAAGELAAFGLSGEGDYTINGTEITLTSGTFSVDSASAEAITIVVNGATLTAAASVNGDVKVSSGHADLKGANALTVDSGSATVTGSVSTISVSDGTGSLHAESATLGEVSVARNNTGEIVIRNSTVGTLNLYNYQGKTEVSGSDVKKVSFGELQSYREDAGKKYWPKQGEQDRLPAAGEVASELRVELNELILPRRGLTYKAPFTLVFVPWDPHLTDGRYPSEANKRVSFNVCLYDKNGNDTSSSTMTILQSHRTANYTAPLTLTGGSVTKTYDGTTDFKNCVVQNPKWTKENWDGTTEDYAGDIGDVIVPSFTAPSKDAGTYTFTPETLTFPSSPENTEIVTSTMPELTAEITKAKVTLSGTFGRHYFPTTLEAVADQLTIDGLAAGDTVADLGITKLTDDTGRDLLDNVYEFMGTTLDVTKVESKPDANYEVTLQNLRMIVYYATLYNVTMPDAYIGLGAPAFPEPELTLDTEVPSPDDRSVKYEYAEEGTENWSETPPTTEGSYQIRVTFGKYGDYFTEEVGTDSFKVEKTEWGGKAIYPVETPYGETFKVQLQLFDYNDGVLPYQQYGYIEVDFEGQTYRGEYDAAATDGYPFTAILPTEGKTTKIGYLQELPVRFYLPSTAGGTDYQLVFTQKAYVTVVKRDLSADLTVTEQTDGTYNGESKSGARLWVKYTGSLGMNITDENTVKVSLTRNGAAYTPSGIDEWNTYNNSIDFEPKLAGEYEMTVRVKDDNSYYTGSFSAKCTVAKRKLVIHANDATIKRGEWRFDAWSCTIKEGSLAGHDYLIFGAPFTVSELKNLPVGKHPFTLTGIKVEYRKDVTDSYEISQIDAATGKDHEAILTVLPKSGNFTIVIPPTASISDGSMTLDCTAIDAGLTVGVTVQSANDFTLTCPENGERLTYDLCRDGTKLADGATAATFTAADSQTLTLSLAGGANIPGTYKDTLTFTALIQ